MLSYIVAMMNTTRLKIARYIKKVRAAYKLSQDEFSGILGIDRATYANYEVGRAEIPGSTLLKIQELEKKYKE